MKKIAVFFVVFFVSSLFSVVYAEPIKVGLATYEIVSSKPADYLSKAIEQTLLSAFQAGSEYRLIPLNETGNSLQKKELSALFQKEKFAAIVTGTVTQLGDSLLINSRIYFKNRLQDPQLISISIEDSRKPLPPLQKHASTIVQQLSSSASTPTPIATKTTQALPEKTPQKTPIEKTPAPSKSTLPPTALSGGLPDYNWMSDRLAFEGQSFAYADLNGDKKPEVIIQDLKRLYIYDWDSTGLHLKTQYDAKPNDHFIKVFAHDLNGDGRPEIIVSNIRNGQASSFGLEINGNEFKPLFENSPWILKLIQWQGQTQLIGERFFGKSSHQHNVKILSLEGNQLKEQEHLPVPSDVGIYGLQGSQAGQLVYLSPSGKVRLFEKQADKYKKVAISSENYGGSSNSIPLQQRSLLNEIENEVTYFNLDPVVDDARGVFVPNNENFLKNVIGTKPIIKNSWIAQLRLENTGLREVWVTRKIEGYLADIKIIQTPWNKKPQLVALLWIRDQGFMNALGKFKSVLVSYNLE